MIHGRVEFIIMAGLSSVFEAPARHKIMFKSCNFVSMFECKCIVINLYQTVWELRNCWDVVHTGCLLICDPSIWPANINLPPVLINFLLHDIDTFPIESDTQVVRWVDPGNHWLFRCDLSQAGMFPHRVNQRRLVEACCVNFRGFEASELGMLSGDKGWQCYVYLACRLSPC